MKAYFKLNKLSFLFLSFLSLNVSFAFAGVKEEVKQLAHEKFEAYFHENGIFIEETEKKERESILHRWEALKEEIILAIEKDEREKAYLLMEEVVSLGKEGYYREFGSPSASYYQETLPLEIQKGGSPNLKKQFSIVDSIGRNLLSGAFKRFEKGLDLFQREEIRDHEMLKVYLEAWHIAEHLEAYRAGGFKDFTIYSRLELVATPPFQKLPLLMSQYFLPTMRNFLLTFDGLIDITEEMESFLKILGIDLNDDDETNLMKIYNLYSFLNGFDSGAGLNYNYTRDSHNYSKPSSSAHRDSSNPFFFNHFDLKTKTWDIKNNFYTPYASQGGGITNNSQRYRGDKNGEEDKDISSSHSQNHYTTPNPRNILPHSAPNIRMNNSKIFFNGLKWFKKVVK